MSPLSSYSGISKASGLHDIGVMTPSCGLKIVSKKCGLKHSDWTLQFYWVSKQAHH